MQLDLHKRFTEFNTRITRKQSNWLIFNFIKFITVLSHSEISRDFSCNVRMAKLINSLSLLKKNLIVEIDYALILSILILMWRSFRKVSSIDWFIFAFALSRLYVCHEIYLKIEASGNKIKPNHIPLTLVSNVRDREKARGTFDVLSAKATKITTTILGGNAVQFRN